MKPLTIERVKGQRQEFTFLGWKHDGLAFYAADPDGKPAVITPVSAYPDDSSSGEPYRFPRIVLLEIIPKQFEIGWSDYHRKVLKRWREAELAEVDAMAPASLFVFGAMHNPRPSRTPAEINQQRQERKMAVEFHFRMLMDIPLEELIFPIAPLTNYRLIDFSSGRWADEMGEDFRSMMSETMAFGKRWRSAYGVGQDYEADQSILRAMRSVQYVMRGDGKKDYHLTGISVRLPTDLEAQAYAQMQELLGGKSAPSQGQSKSAEPKAKATKVKVIEKPNALARFENDFSLAVIPQRKGEPLPIAIEEELQKLLKRIAEAGGRIARTKLCKDKPDGYQPEKLLRSKIAKALMDADLLGSKTTGRTTVFWLKMPVE